MNAKQFCVFYCLFFAAVQANELTKRNASFLTTLRHFHRLFLFLKTRIELMAVDAKPLANKLTDDNPEIAEELYGVIHTISNMYYNKRLLYLQEEFSDLLSAFLIPIATTDDECAASLYEGTMGTFKPAVTELMAIIKTRINKIQTMLEDTQPLLDWSWDYLLESAENAAEQAKQCKSEASENPIPCLFNSLVPLANDLDSLINDDSFQELVSNLIAIVTEIISAGGGVTGAIVSIIQDLWTTFARCIQNQRYLRYMNYDFYFF